MGAGSATTPRATCIRVHKIARRRQHRFTSLFSSVAGSLSLAAHAGSGPAHLCDAVQCRLPVEEFWKVKRGEGQPKLERSKSARF